MRESLYGHLRYNFLAAVLTEGFPPLTPALDESLLKLIKAYICCNCVKTDANAVSAPAETINDRNSNALYPYFQFRPEQVASRRQIPTMTQFESTQL